MPDVSHRRRFIVIALQAALICDGALSGIPQVLRIVQQRSSADVSALSWGWMFTMACLWGWQARRDGSRVSFWGSVVWAITNLTVLLTCLAYR